jgi:hypothetical protein
MGHCFGTVEYVTTATKDYGYAAKMHYEFWKVKVTRKKCSQNFDMTMWFVAEKFKQRGLDRNLYADWIVLLKEQFTFRINGFLDFVHRPQF